MSDETKKPASASAKPEAPKAAAAPKSEPSKADAPKADAKPATKPDAPKADAKPDAKPAGGGAHGHDGSSGAWKKASIVLFIIAGLAIVGAVDYHRRLGNVQDDMTKLKAQVAAERTAMKAEQEKFKQETASITEQVEKAKATLAATEADIEKRKAEAAELETKLTGLYTETKSALAAASDAAEKQVQAQASLDKLNKERDQVVQKITTAKKELAGLEKETGAMLQTLKDAFAKIRGALDKL